MCNCKSGSRKAYMGFYQGAVNEQNCSSIDQRIKIVTVSMGAGPKCRHGRKPGVNLKGLFNRKMKITAMLEKN